MNERIGIGKPLVERCFIPGEIGALHLVGIAVKALIGPGFASPNFRETRAGHVLARRRGMTCRARLKDRRATRGISGDRRESAHYEETFCD